MTPEQTQLITRFMNGEFNNHPVVLAIQKMLNGKTPQEKAQILINLLRSRGVDVDNLRFTKEELRNFGLIV